MGLLKRLSYDWDKLAIAVEDQINKKIIDLKNNQEIPSSMIISQYISQCRFVKDLLAEQEIKLNKFDRWLIKESNLVSNECEEILIDYIDTKFLNSDLILRVIAFSAIIAYCSQFDINDSEFFYYLYERTLKNKSLRCRVSPI